jgi:hypothetical protein
VKAHHLINGAAFTPDMLRVIFQAFDDAWAEIGADVSIRAGALETARLSLATIVLTLATRDPIERRGLKTAAVHAFQRKHRLMRTGERWTSRPLRAPAAAGRRRRSSR